MGLKLQSTKRRAHAANRNSSQPGIQTRTHTSAPRYMITVFGILPDASKLSVGKRGKQTMGWRSNKGLPIGGVGRCRDLARFAVLTLTGTLGTYHPPKV